jgi:indolepyruvate ferredoxin oxidoreductase alpha subunit
MSARLLLGDEAIAQGALDAGISGCYAYPGTPSTEITEYVQGSPEASARGIACQWACNEKTAMEAALGMSYAGRRALVCMKHVGLNVASDGFMNAAITGAHGGLVVVAADDPSMHSSQNEQDSRFYGSFAQVPMFEPATQQEAYAMMAPAFALSEELETPVLLRLTTRLAHSRANVIAGTVQAEKPLALPKENPWRFVLLPPIARANYARHLMKQPRFAELAEKSPFNHFQDGSDRSLGIVACGIAYNYVLEAFGGTCPHPLLKIGQYPVPKAALRDLQEKCPAILVLEDGQPFLEASLHGATGPDPRVRGRLTGHLPAAGELTPETVAAALGKGAAPKPEETDLLRGRPPRLCPGCPHIFSYNALNEALGGIKGHVFSDIGCYTLGAMPPFNAINTCVDMGASISMAKGAADAGLRPAVAVIGDSTFTHSGMTSLLDAIWADSPMTVLILDNYTTGMTGGQDSAALGKLETIVRGLGVKSEHLRILDPLPSKHAENVAVLKEELAHPGLSVVIFQRECLQTLRRKAKKSITN